jgi:hypothetical protein
MRKRKHGRANQYAERRAANVHGCLLERSLCGEQLIDADVMSEWETNPFPQRVSRMVAGRLAAIYRRRSMFLPYSIVYLRHAG